MTSVEQIWPPLPWKPIKLEFLKHFFIQFWKPFPSNLTEILLKDPLQGQIGRS
jgi:hypothetical protein